MILKMVLWFLRNPRSFVDLEKVCRNPRSGMELAWMMWVVATGTYNPVKNGSFVFFCSVHGWCLCC